MIANWQLDKLIRPNILAMKPYSSARDEYDNMAGAQIFLDANENPFENGLNRYPDPQQLKLKRQLSKLKGIPIGGILIGNGSDEVLDLIIRVFCNPGQDSVMTTPPTYGMYSVLASINDVINLEVPLTDDFQLDINSIKNVLPENCKLIFLCSPNNPSGNAFKYEDIEEILSFFPGMVVIDEAYADFNEGNSWLARLPEFPNLIVTQTLSKAYGHAGIRLGIAYASAKVLYYINKIKPPYNVNALTQIRALEVLEDQHKLKRDVQLLINERKSVAEKLSRLSMVFKVFPSDSNFLLVRVDDANLRYQQLIGQGIVVRNRHTYPLCGNCLRITIGTPEENERLLACLKNIDRK